MYPHSNHISRCIPPIATISAGVSPKQGSTIKLVHNLMHVHVVLYTRVLYPALESTVGCESSYFVCIVCVCLCMHTCTVCIHKWFHIHVLLPTGATNMSCQISILSTQCTHQVQITPCAFVLAHNNALVYPLYTEVVHLHETLL